MAETTNLPLHQLLEPMQYFLGDPRIWLYSTWKHNHLALAIAKKTLDENLLQDCPEGHR